MIGAVILALIILIVSQVYLSPPQEEVPLTEGLTNLMACPSGLKEYTTNNAVNCCEGEVLGGKCQGEAKCTLSSKSNGLPHCSKYYETYMTDKAIRNCPASMPNYYEIDRKGYCTSAQLRNDGMGPISEAGATFCSVLATPEERHNSPKSCLNVRRLEEMNVTTSGQEQVTKNVISQAAGKPVLLAATITNGLRSRVCYDRHSAELYLDATTPQWRSDPQIIGEITRMQQSGEFCA